MAQDKPEPLAPLLDALEAALALLNLDEVKSRLRPNQDAVVRRIQTDYDKYVTCCCHRGTINPIPGPRPPSTYRDLL